MRKCSSDILESVNYFCKRASNINLVKEKLKLEQKQRKKKETKFPGGWLTRLFEQCLQRSKYFEVHEITIYDNIKTLKIVGCTPKPTYKVLASEEVSCMVQER
jgi:hypothetical protein